MDKTDQQIFEDIVEINRKLSCEDNEEVRDIIQSINDQVSTEGKKLHEESTVIDLCTFSLERYSWNLAASGVTAMNCTVPGTKDDAGAAVRSIIDYCNIVRDDPEHFMMIFEPDDVIEAKRKNKVGIIVGAQSCDFVHHDCIEASVDLFHRMGLRIMTIAYNHRTFAADGCYTGDNAGITNDGKKLIHAMEECGVTVDLSHVGDRSTLEAMDICLKPPIFSHSNPRGLFQHVRNITDEQAKKCAALGGVIGVSSYAPTLFDGNEFPTIETFVNCIDYYVDLIGIDHVGVGLDTDATVGGYGYRNMMNLTKLRWETAGKDGIEYKGYVAGRGYLSKKVEGLMNIANFCNVTDGLLKRGYTDQDIKKIIGENWLRIFRETW